MDTPVRRWRPPSRAVVLLAAVLVLALGGGLWVLREAEPALRLARAADATVAARTARIRLATTVSGLPLLGDVTLDVARGEVDLQAQQASLVREIPGVAAIPFVGARVDPVELRFDAGDVFVRLPVGGGRRWAQVRDVAGDRVDASSLAHPGAVLGLLHVLDGQPEVLGEERIDEALTTRFRILVDLDEAIARLGEGPGRVAQGLRQLHGRPQLPIEVWLDDADRVRRMRYALETSLRGIDVTLINDLELSAFGIVVDTAPPPADELITLTDVELPELDALELLRGLLERATP